MDYELETATAIDAVRRAAELCSAVRAELVVVDSLQKSDKSPVTVADYGAQALIGQRLQATFPGDPIVSEESSRELQRPKHAASLFQVTQYVQRFERAATPLEVCAWIDASKGGPTTRFWTLDPIDGTKGFLRDDQYAIALALIELGQVRVAVLGCPALPVDVENASSGIGALFVAVRGQGAEMRPLAESSIQSLQVADGSSSRSQRLVESMEAAHGDAILQEAVARDVCITSPALKMDSQAKYAAVARGDASLYLRLPSPASPDYREKIWDHAAGSLIVEEAGGRVTDMRGNALDFSSGVRMRNNVGVVASNGFLHEGVLTVLEQAAQ
jgi:3'(2'), 5'-bisphosphate nucleotidase